MKRKTLVGFVASDPVFQYTHPFLSRARKIELGVPEVHVTKTRKGLPATRYPAEGSTKSPAKPFGAREQARAEKFKRDHSL